LGYSIDSRDSTKRAVFQGFPCNSVQIGPFTERSATLGDTETWDATWGGDVDELAGVAFEFLQAIQVSSEDANQQEAPQD
jgi:hypothetical protein